MGPAQKPLNDAADYICQGSMYSKSTLIAFSLITCFLSHTGFTQTKEELQVMQQAGIRDVGYYDQSKGNSADWMGGKSVVSSIISLPLSGMMLMYQNLLSPQISSSCQFALSCSNFSKAAFKEYGIVKGMALTLDRLYRCNGNTHAHYGRPYRDEEGLLQESICEHY